MPIDHADCIDVRRRCRSRSAASAETPRAWHAIFLTVLAAFALSTVGARADDATSPYEADLAAARAATRDFGEKLRSELMAALKVGGASAAVGVCRTIAPSLAEDATRSHGLDVGRTALKVRNPDNVPDAFERRVLQDFVQKIAEGADPAALEHAEVIVNDGGTMFRYMKAIPMAAEPCLICHGTNIEPALHAEILELYPDDQATGFEAGELRGAFTVTRKMP